jgi:hypothetical protein
VAASFAALATCASGDPDGAGRPADTFSASGGPADADGGATPQADDPATLLDVEGDREPTPGPSPAPSVCFAGPSGDDSVCVPLVDPDPLPADYDYAPGFMDDPNYRPPLRFLDLDSLDAELPVAPSFTLGELARAWQGPLAIVQPHAVVRLQALRDALGPLAVHSGYRSPGYNAAIGGAMHSRHMYGDAFDLEPLAAPLDDLAAACLEQNAFVVEYDTHIHCDWRDDPVDERFFGPLDGE